MRFERRSSPASSPTRAVRRRSVPPCACWPRLSPATYRCWSPSIRPSTASSRTTRSVPQPGQSVVFPHTDQLQAIALSTKYNLLETLLWLIWTVFKKLVHVIYQTRKRFFRMTIDGVENIGRRSEWVSFLGYRKQ